MCYSIYPNQRINFLHFVYAETKQPDRESRTQITDIKHQKM